QVIQSTEMRGDERVDVWGFFDVAPEETFLRNAYFEVVRPQTPDLNVATPAPNPAATNPAALLTDVSQILKLRREEAALQLPVRLQGVITYADPEWRNGF